MPEPDQMTRQRAHMPEGGQKILNARSLQTANRRLAVLLQPGMGGLDAGGGTGTITRGIAAVVGTQGRVGGVDVNADLITAAQQAYAGTGACALRSGCNVVSSNTPRQKPVGGLSAASPTHAAEPTDEPVAVRRTSLNEP